MADIKPFIDPVFDNNVLLTQTERLMMSNRPKDPKNARNKNILVIGGSGSGKTRFFCKPNIMQLHSSYVITDPKGSLICEVGQLLQRAKYRIAVLNTINFSKSMHYNPFAYLRTEKDILKLVNTIIINTKGEGAQSTEDFWVKAERLYYTALIGYIHYEAPEEEKNFITLLDMINASDTREDDEDYGDTKRKLENEVFRTAGVAQKHNCTLTRLDFQQERGLVSSLPLGENQIHITRGMTTSAVAIIVPFVTQELFQGGDSLYYGLNAKSGNMIMLDRKNARSPNGLVFGTPGGGKSFSCKREMIGVLLKTHDHVLVCDPEGEYAPLVKLLHGQIIKLSPTSRDYLNPLDINLNYSEDENPLALKSDFVLSLCELIMGGKTGLEAIERTVIDRAVQRIYQPYFADPRPENMPILSDLHAALTAQHLPEADRVAQALDLYVSGSLNFFNNRTTVDIDNRFVCFDIKELPKNLKKPGMLVIQDQVWNRVTRNRNTGVSTWYYADEFHLLLKEPQTAAYSAEIWKRFRKWGGVPTGATQNVKDLLSSPEIENILENSDFICMLNQAAGDRKILAERLNISPEQLKFVTNSPPGEGLLFFENVILPFADKFPRDTELYRIMSTKPSEVNGV